ncbi:MAG TPA: hypothetical protein DEF45_24135 [Rhodopirellula sp.]|nr:MAG: hypothetical protein CBD74_02510 [Saprospirales bacterium TMED214]HBV66104.1 hypothetical protein [Rhodopirellula sp.]
MQGERSDLTPINEKSLSSKLRCEGAERVWRGKTDGITLRKQFTIKNVWRPEFSIRAFRGRSAKTVMIQEYPLLVA